MICETCMGPIDTCVYTPINYYSIQKVDTEDVNQSGLLSPSAALMSDRFATPVSTASVFMPAWLPKTMSVCNLHTKRAPMSALYTRTFYTYTPGPLTYCIRELGTNKLYEQANEIGSYNLLLERTVRQGTVHCLHVRNIAFHQR